MARKTRPKGKKSVGETYEVGCLVATTPDDCDSYIESVKNALRKDANITFLPPGGAKGDLQKIRDAASYFASTVHVIVTSGTPAALACKEATKTNKFPPFVFASVGDPKISGLIPQKGDNFTGGSNQQVTAAKARVDYMVNKKFEDKIAVVGNDRNEPIRSAMD